MSSGCSAQRSTAEFFGCPHCCCGHASAPATPTHAQLPQSLGAVTCSVGRHGGSNCVHWVGEEAAPAAELEGSVLSRVLGGGSRGGVRCSERQFHCAEREYVCAGGCLRLPPTHLTSNAPTSTGGGRGSSGGTHAPPDGSLQSTQSSAAMMRLLQEVLELLPESGRQAAL